MICYTDSFDLINCFETGTRTYRLVVMAVIVCGLIVLLSIAVAARVVFLYLRSRHWSPRMLGWVPVPLSVEWDDCRLDMASYRMTVGGYARVRYRVTSLNRGASYWGNDFVRVFQRGVGLEDVSTLCTVCLLRGASVFMEQRFRLRGPAPLTLLPAD